MVKIGFGMGLWAIGFLGAILLGVLEHFAIITPAAWIPTLLIVVALLIGILNVTDKEAMHVIIAALLLGGASIGLGSLPVVEGLVDAVLGKIALISIPVAIPPAVKIMYTKLQ